MICFFKMRKYATVFDFCLEGEVGLVKKLKALPVRIEDSYLSRNIYDESARGNRLIGNIDKFNGRCHLYVLEIKENPLKEFIETYEAKRGNPRNNNNGQRKSK